MAGVVATLLSTGPESVGGRAVERYSLSNGSPTIVGGSAAGTATGGVAAISGPGGVALDTYGQITITTGTTTLAGPGTLATITFANTMSGTPSPIITAANNNAAALMAGTAAAWATAGTTTSWTIQSGSATPLTAYIFDYAVPDARTTLTVTTRYISGPDSATGPTYSQSFSGRTATLGMKPDFTGGRLTISGLY